MYLLQAIPTMPVYDENRLGGYGGADNVDQRAITLNVIGYNKLLENTNKRNRFIGNIWGELEIVKGLKYKLRASADVLDYKDRFYVPVSDLGWYYITTNDEASLDVTSGNTTRTIVDNLLSYNLEIDKHKFDVLSKNKKYMLEVLSQILYVGAQIMCWTYIYQYAEAIMIDSVTAGYYQMAAFIIFTVGRAVGTYMLRFMSSGKLLMYFAVLAIVFTLGAIWIQGIVGLYSLVAVSFCMSLMFPTICGIALGDLTEEQSKVGSAGLIMAIVGGALMPKLQGIIIDIGGNGVSDTNILGVSEVNFSFILPLFCFVFIAWYGLKVHKEY